MEILCVEQWRGGCVAVWARARRSVVALVVALGVAGLAGAAETDAPVQARSSAELLPAIQLAPFVVQGERLAISVLARSKADRRYAERFAEDVIEVTYATLESSPGAGLVIIGEEKEPHPVFVFRKFIALAEAQQLDPALTAMANELSATMRRWEARMQFNNGDTMELPMDTIVKALPLPLEGVGSKLYQIAWEERFDEQRVEHRLRALTTSELARDELTRFDWVFYLPPREAAGEAIKAVVPTVLKKEKVGVLKRAAIRSAMVVFAPAIKKAVEGARKGMLFMTVFRARSGLSDEEVNLLTGAYVRVLMPDFKLNESTTHERAIAAIEAQKVVNAEYAKDPFVTPARLVEFEPTAYAKFEGDYAEKRETTHRFAREGYCFTWQYLDRTPAAFYPAGERLFVSENGSMTIEFQVDEHGAVTGVEERWVRRRKTVPRQTEPPAETARVKERRGELSRRNSIQPRRDTKRHE